MSNETIPLSFEAVDNLTKGVGQMTAMLERMGAAQKETTEATEDATKATEEQSAASSRFGDMLVKLNAGVELAKSTHEALGGAIDWIKGSLTASNEQWDEQSRKAGRAASSLGSVAEANAKLEKAQNKVFASVGQLIDRSSVYQAVAATQTELLKEFNGWLKENSEEIARWGNNLAINGSQKLQELGQWVQQNSESIARWGLYLKGTGQLVLTTVSAVDALAEALKVGLYGAVALTAEGLATLTDGLIHVLKLSGQEVPQALEDLRLGLDGIAKDAGGATVSAMDKLNAKLDRTAEVGTDAFESLGKASFGSRAEISSTIDLVDKLGKKTEEVGARLEKNLKKGMAGKGKARGDLVDPETAAEEKRQALLLEYDRQIIEAEQKKDALRAAELTKQRALVELGQSLRDIKTGALRDATESLGLLQAQIEYEDKLKAIADAKKADARELYEIEEQARREQLERDEADAAAREERGRRALDAIQARREAEIESARAIAEAVEEGFGGLGDLLGEVDEQTSRIVASLERGVGQSAKFGAALRALVVNNKSLKESANEVNAAISAGAGVASSLVSGLVDNAKTRAKIEAAINGAAAVAATAFGLATGNPAFFAAAAGHASAALKYGLAASGVFDGGASSSGASAGAGGGSGAAGGASYQSVDLDRERGLTAEALAEAIAQNGRGGGTTINVDFGNSLIASETPQAARIITDLLRPELEQIMRRPD